MRELNSTEEKILDRVLYLIGKMGTFHVPVRAIAKEANVNVSAVNYYFKTKAELMRYVKEFYLANTKAAYSALENEEYSDEEKIIAVANEIMEYSLKYPGVLIILKEARKNKDKDELNAKIIETTKELNDKLYHLLTKVLNPEDMENRYNHMIFMSSIVYPVFNMDITPSFDREVLLSKNERLKYIKYLLEQLKNKK